MHYGGRVDLPEVVHIGVSILDKPHPVPRGASSPFHHTMTDKHNRNYRAAPDMIGARTSNPLEKVCKAWLLCLT